MADIEKVKQGCKCCDHPLGERKCKKCPYAHFLTPYCNIYLAHDAMSVIEELQAEIERLKAQKQKWLQNIADQQLAVSPTGYETEEGLAKRTGEWNGLQMAWEILTKE